MLHALFLTVALQVADGEAALHKRVAAQPPAIRAFMERRAMCNHWGGEEPYDADRRRQIAAAIRDLGCITLHGEEIFLRRHFARRADTLRLLDEIRDESGWVAAPQDSD